jgi:hypothetical protein
VLVDDRRVLHRHVPTGEGHEFRTERHVGGFERGAFDFGNHAAETESETPACQSACEFRCRENKLINPLNWFFLANN